MTDLPEQVHQFAAHFELITKGAESPERDEEDWDFPTDVGSAMEGLSDLLESVSRLLSLFDRRTTGEPPGTRVADLCDDALMHLDLCSNAVVIARATLAEARWDLLQMEPAATTQLHIRKSPTHRWTNWGT